jgi:hypothetical protein
MKRIVGTFTGAALVGLLVLGLLAVPSGASPAGASAACTPATDIEAIIDDSGSMAITDPNRLRVQAMDLLIQTLPSSTTLGAVEFGSGYEGIPGIVEGKPAADTVFPPEPIGPNATSMQTALKAAIDAENGATDYNGAFAKADADNPNSDARIFLTDGGHDVGTYNEAHLAHNVPTYVIGFGTAFSSAEDKARLEKIAADTGGQLFQPKDASQLQAVVNDVGAALTCQTQPRLFSDELAKGQSKTHSVSVGAATKSLQVTLTWANPLSHFKLGGLRLISHGQVVAVARPHKVAKLRVKVKAKSSTFTVLQITHLRKGKLRFAVKATKVGSGESKATVTTQVGSGGK